MDNIVNGYILFFVCITGLCLGSFYNVVILRSLSGENIAFPPSKCPKCGHKLHPIHNIPVLSYIFLRGKCYFCREKISIQYPLVELITMGLFVLTYLKFGLSLTALFTVIILSAMLIMTATDLKEQVVDCKIAVGLAIIAIIFNLIISGNPYNSILGLIIGALILEITARLGYLFTKTRAMGEADTYVAGALGACFGAGYILSILLYSLAASMIFIVPVFIYNQYKNGNRITCILLVLFLLSAFGFKTISQNYCTFALLVLTGAALTVSVLKNIKKEENHTYLPFVPAFSAGVLYFLFF